LNRQIVKVIHIRKFMDTDVKCITIQRMSERLTSDAVIVVCPCFTFNIKTYM